MDVSLLICAMCRGELQQKMDGNIRAISLKECRALMQQFDSSKEVSIYLTCLLFLWNDSVAACV